MVPCSFVASILVLVYRKGPEPWTMPLAIAMAILLVLFNSGVFSRCLWDKLILKPLTGQMCSS
jgi:hypothetical protein